jgi:hypothetical protein
VDGSRLKIGGNDLYVFKTPSLQAQMFQFGEKEEEKDKVEVASYGGATYYYPAWPAYCTVLSPGTSSQDEKSAASGILYETP